MEFPEERKSQVVSHLRGSARRIQQIERAIQRIGRIQMPCLLLILGWASWAHVFLCKSLLFIHKGIPWCLMCRLVASYSNLHRMHFWIFVFSWSGL